MSRCNSRPIIITYNPESKGSWVQYFYETYKKGDKVKVVGNNRCHEYEMGLPYVVSAVKYNYYILEPTPDSCECIDDRDLELVEPDMSNTPEVGDSIKMLVGGLLEIGSIHPIDAVTLDDPRGQLVRVDGYWPRIDYYKLIKKKTMEFSKKDLKTGDVLVFDNGESCVVFKDLRSNEDCCSDGKQVWFPLTHLSDGLVREIGGYKVVSVYSPDSNYDTGRIRCRNNLVWEREEEVTEIDTREVMKILAESLGKDVKNIRIKD